VCCNSFFDEPLLQYENMPKAAQFLPNTELLEKDKGINLEIYQCSGCGLVQLKSDPVPYYREVVRAAAFSSDMKEFRIKQFGNWIKKNYLKGKKVIEIGCGRGEFLSIIQQLGVKAYGLEYSEDSVKQCINNGLKVSKGFIKNSADALKDAPFDAFFILNFLEHLPDPNSTLRGIYHNLIDDGIGLVEVPNFDMILRNKLFSEFASDHLCYFTVGTLTSTLLKNGFEIIECKEEWHDYILSAVVKKREKLDLSHLVEYQAQLKNDLEEYINRFKDGKVAIWGAGHQALTIISLLDLADKVRYVVDSAEFKQGRYTPATHIPIVPPDTLNSDPVDAVIVMAASYSDEVGKIIRKKFDRNIECSILRDYGLEIVKGSQID
jgi:2-polyprenyl-3-methyl-5-hydroxy-6-metoxy-1,4-benzoquinol methylase